MAPRLSHKKSRLGCNRCKTRRVKCDETRPACSSCMKHGVPCEYRDPFLGVPIRTDASQPPDNSESLGSDGHSSPVRLVSPYADLEAIGHAFDPEERRKLELHLLHHYMAVVTYTFPGCHEQLRRDIWNIDAVRLGFEHSFLFNSILAISSRHIVSDTERGPKFYAKDTNSLSVTRALNAATMSHGDIDYSKAHRIYLNLATQQQREAISKISGANADAIFLASVLLSYQTLNLLTDQPAPPFYSPPIQWLTISKAISAIAGIARPLLQNDSIMELVISSNHSPDFRDCLTVFNPLNRRHFEALLDWENYPEPDFDSETKDTYEQALSYVGSTYQAILDKESPRALLKRLMSLGFMVPGHYIRLLRQGRPRALAILGHHFAMTVAIDDHWWLRGVAEREVHGIRSVLPDDWQWAMEWPLLMIRVGRGEWLTKATI